MTEITLIASLPNYANNNNDQSVVEICVTRVTSCIRETGSVEQHCEALVNLLESCLHHNLQLSSRGEDPPHAKISSDIISCIFLVRHTFFLRNLLYVAALQNYSKKSVMERALPVAVKFLHKGNIELSRNMASYLSLAAIEHATLLSPHVQPIMDSIISGILVLTVEKTVTNCFCLWINIRKCACTLNHTYIQIKNQLNVRFRSQTLINSFILMN